MCYVKSLVFFYLLELSDNSKIITFYEAMVFLLFVLSNVSYVVYFDFVTNFTLAFLTWDTEGLLQFLFKFIIKCTTALFELVSSTTAWTVDSLGVLKSNSSLWVHSVTAK